MSRWVVTAVLLVGGVGCYQRADRGDEDVEMDEVAEPGSQAGRTGGSGVGGQSGSAGGATRSGAGASGVAATSGRAGGSGVGGTSGRAGGSGIGGQGGRAGSRGSPICSDEEVTRQQWCDGGYTHCDLSRDQLLAQLCRPVANCSDFSCQRIVTAANGCGGSSVEVSYGVDVAFVIHHYDEHGLLIGGLRSQMLECLQGGSEYLFGEQCALTNHQVVDCQDVAADGGT